MLLYWHIDVGPQTGGRYAHADGDVYGASLADPDVGATRAHEDIAANGNPMVAAIAYTDTRGHGYVHFECDANGDADLDPDAFCYTDDHANGDLHAISYRHGHANRGPDHGANGHTDQYADGDGNEYPNGDPFAHGGSDRHGDANGIRDGFSVGHPDADGDGDGDADQWVRYNQDLDRDAIQYRNVLTFSHKENHCGSNPFIETAIRG